MTSRPELSQQANRAGFPVWLCPSCQLPNDMLRATCRNCQAHRPCEYRDGQEHCGAVPVHMYTSGPRCDPHQPSAIRTRTTTQEAA